MEKQIMELDSRLDKLCDALIGVKQAYMGLSWEVKGKINLNVLKFVTVSLDNTLLINEKLLDVFVNDIIPNSEKYFEE